MVFYLREVFGDDGIHALRTREAKPFLIVYCLSSLGEFMSCARWQCQPVPDQAQRSGYDAALAKLQPAIQGRNHAASPVVPKVPSEK